MIIKIIKLTNCSNLNHVLYVIVSSILTLIKSMLKFVKKSSIKKENSLVAKNKEVSVIKESDILFKFFYCLFYSKIHLIVQLNLNIFIICSNKRLTYYILIKHHDLIKSVNHIYNKITINLLIDTIDKHIFI